MDLLGDIVEKDTADQEEPEFNGNSNVSGFPELYKPKKISSWKERLMEKKRNEKKPFAGKSRANVKLHDETRTEAQSIHEENINRLKNMSQEEILNERKSLMESLEPKLIQNLLKNINKRAQSNDSAPLFAEIEGASGTWVGGENENALKNLPSLDKIQVDRALGVVASQHDITNDIDRDNNLSVKWEEDDIHSELVKGSEEYEREPINDIDDVAPLDYQMAQSIDHMTNDELMADVHFMKSTIHSKEEVDEELKLEKLDINDPDFNQKLHDKYFPDLPKDIDKLKWMERVPDLPENAKSIIIQDVAQCRFDFKGNLVPPSREVNTTIHSGLHHHSTDPQLAGYTLVELSHLSRSKFSSQRCIAIQIIGRVLYKLGKQSYEQLVPEIDSETYKEDGSIKNVMNKIYAMFWDLIKDLQIIDSLKFGAEESLTKNLSVRSYATDALWLWQQGGGDFRK